jgi:GNAT superfamily N-acetyltransferase
VFCSGGSCTAILVDERGVRAKAVADLNVLGSHLEWWVARVLVSNADDRGKGLGSLVLQAALKAIMVSTNGMARVVVVPGGYDNNHKRQRKFYEKNGFRRVNDEGLMECGCSPESH